MSEEMLHSSESRAKGGWPLDLLSCASAGHRKMPGPAGTRWQRHEPSRRLHSASSSPADYPHPAVLLRQQLPISSAARSEAEDSQVSAGLDERASRVLISGTCRA